MDTNTASLLLDRLLDEVESESLEPTPASVKTGTAPTTPTAQAPPASGLASLLGGLAADPAVLTSVLPAMLSAFGGGSSSKGEPASLSSERPLPPDRHTALICAVKPYLGERRQATADTVLKLCRIWDALNRAGLSPAVLGKLLGGMNAAAATGDEALPIVASPTDVPTEGGM